PVLPLDPRRAAAPARPRRRGRRGVPQGTRPCHHDSGAPVPHGAAGEALRSVSPDPPVVRGPGVWAPRVLALSPFPTTKERTPWTLVSTSWTTRPRWRSAST